MEDSARVDATLRIYRAIAECRATRTSGRFCKRIFTARRPTSPASQTVSRISGSSKARTSSRPAVAYPKKPDVDAAFKRLIEQALEAGGYTAIATHDEDAIRHATSFIQARAIPKDRFEFQMLYGVRPALQRQVRDQGYTVRIAAPFGREWYPYFMRRLAERPANVAFVLRSFLKG